MTKKLEETFGALLKLARERKSWTQAELGARTGICVTRISRYENGTEPRFETLLVLCGALETSPNELLGFAENEDW